MPHVFRERAKLVREQRTLQVLAVLLNEPLEAQTVETVGTKTGLAQVVYPLLAALHRQEFLELEWRRVGSNDQLAYRLTEEGFSHARRLTATSQAPSTPQPIAQPLYSRLARRISKQLGNL